MAYTNRRARHNPSAGAAANASPSTFDGSPFFNNGFANFDQDDDGMNEDFFAGVGELSKFESFLEKKSSRQGNAAAAGRGGGGAPNAISPRSDDGMSFVSRKKHDNYANVVQEMKRKQSNAAAKRQGVVQQQPQQQFQQQQRQGEWGFDESFGSQNHFNATPQKQQQSQQFQQQQQRNSPQNYSQQHFYQQHSQQMRSTSTPRQQQQQGRLAPSASDSNANIAQRGRSGRTLYRDRPTSSSSGANNNNHNGMNSNNGGNGAAQPTPSQRSRSTVRRTADLQRKIAQTYITQFDDNASEVGSCAGSYIGASHSGGGLGNSGSYSGEDFGLIGIGGNRRAGGGGEMHGRNDSMGSNMSGESFPMQQPQQQQLRNSPMRSHPSNPSPGRSGSSRNLSNLLERKSSTHSNTSSFNDDNGSVASGTGSVAARRRAKAAFANNRATAPPTTPNKQAPAIPPPSNASGARRNMRMRMQNRTAQSPGNGYNAATASPITKQQHGESLNAFKIDSFEIDDEVNMALSELKLDHPDMDFTFGRVGSSGGGSVDSSVNSGSYGGGSGGGDMPSPLQSPLQQTKQCPTYVKGVVGGKGRMSPATIGTKSLTLESTVESNATQRVVNSHHINRPAVGLQSKPTESEEGVSPVISVEQHSESSSLTDTSDWQHSGGNMFKDATKGSTFHKSKKIVRPGESIPENVAIGSKLPHDVPVEESDALPSIQDRISQFKDSSTTSPNATSKKLSQPVLADNEPQQKSVVTSASRGVLNSPFIKKDISTAKAPPKLPASESPSSNSNPFAVKLRKTKNALDEVVTNTEYLSDGEDEEPASSSPFFSNVKLRKTGVTTPQSSERNVNNKAMGDANEISQDHTIPAEELKRKLTYREQQDLMKAQKEQEEEPQSDDDKPVKDVATLIRERVAMAKQTNEGSPNYDKVVPDLNSIRGNLKKAPQKRESSEKQSCGGGVSSPSFVKQYSSPSAPKQPVESPQSDTKNALNAMLTSRAKTSDSVKTDPEPADPRAALMAMLNKRAQPIEDEKEEEANPKTNLEAMLAKRSATSPSTNSKIAAKNNIAAMLQSRAAQSSQSEPQSSNNAKSAINSMLANRASPDVTSKVDESPCDDSRPPLKSDPKYTKYVKMLKVGMPLPVVQHAMTRDGLDPSVIEGDLNKPAPDPKPEGVPLKEDPAYAKYFKMLKLGLPMGAVKNAMERDGVDSSVMDGDHNAPASSLNSNSPATAKREKDTHRRTRLHWDTLGQVKSNTVWAMVEEDQELEQIEIDEKEFTNLFQAEIKASSAPTERSNSAPRNVVQVIDPKRANNGGIILARLRMSYDDMAKAVERM